jgi:basic membrane protein A
MLVKRNRAISTAASVTIVILIVIAGIAAYYLYASSQPQPSKKTIGVVFDVGGRGDLSFNDMAYLGATKAAQDFGLEVIGLQSPTQNDYVPNLEKLASSSNPPVIIIAVGFLLTDAVNKTAREFPNQKFAIIDGFVPGLPNVLNVGFKENEGSAVVGALAAFVSDCYSKKGMGQYAVGTVLGIPIPVLYKFEIGYKWGVHWAMNYSKEIGKPINNITVLYKYTNTFNDPTVGEQTALAQFQQGAVVSYNIAGATGNGIFKAAQEIAQGKTMGPPFGIGVDSDQDWIAPGFILASMEKRVDVGVYVATQLAINGSWNDYVQKHQGVLELGMKQNGIKMSDVADVQQFLQIAAQAGKSLNATDIMNKIQEMRNKVVQDCGPVYEYANTLANLIKTGQVNVPYVVTTDALNYWRNRLGG